MNKASRLLVSCAVVMSFLLSACSGLTSSDKPATRIWWLEPYSSGTSTSLAEAETSLEVMVRVVPGLDSDKILTLSGAAQLNYIAGAQWADNLPELVQSLTVRSLQASGRFEAGNDFTVEDPGVCELELEVREFFARTDSTQQVSSVQVEMQGRYHCKTGEPIRLQLGASITVNDESMSGIVAAFQTGVDVMMKQLLRQLP